MDAALASLRNQGIELEIIIQDADVEPDKGQSDALNKGFAKAHGEWLFWLNADDVLLPGALKRIVRMLECPDFAALRRDGSECSNDWVAGNMVEIVFPTPVDA